MPEHAVIDFETRSVCDISLGGFKYAEHETTEVLMLGWKLPDGDAEVWQMGDSLDSLSELFAWVASNKPVAGWNIGLFDLPIWNYCFTKLGNVPTLKLAQCHDYMTWAGAMSLPQSLDACGQYFDLGDAAKDKEGKRLITVFCKPRRASKANTALYWDKESRADKWQQFIEYCRQDIIATTALGQSLGQLSDQCQDDWVLTQKINHAGIPVSINESAALADAVDEYKDWVGDEIDKLTDGEITSPSQTAKIKAWVNENSELDLPDVTAPTVTNTLALPDLPEKVKTLLGLRKYGSSTAATKLRKFARAAMFDQTLKGSYRFLGCSTGRFSSSGASNLQNIARGSIADVGLAIERMQTWSISDLVQEYGSVTMPAAGCIRGMLKAEEGSKWVQADYSSIENRVASWVAGDGHTLGLFADGLDQYIDFATYIFDVKYADVDKGQRQIAKSGVLGSMFGAGAKTLKAYIEGYGVHKDVEWVDENLTQPYRKKYRIIRNAWYDFGDSAMKACRNIGHSISTDAGLVSFRHDGVDLWMQLPSGRSICFPKAHVDYATTPWGEQRLAVKAWRMNTYTRQWGFQALIGSTGFFQSAVQGAAFDLLMNAIRVCDGLDWDIRMTTHDEIIAQEPLQGRNHNELCFDMCRLPDWAEGLPLAAEGASMQRYCK